MRIVGAVLAFAACIYAGFIRLCSLKERETCLDAAAESLMHIRNSMDRTNAALPEIFSALSRHCSGQAGRFFALLAEQADCIGERRMQEIWVETVRHVFTELDDRESNELIKLGYILGGSDCQTQLREIESCEKSLEAALNALRHELPEKKKLALGLSATAGAFTVILLI